VHLRNRSGRTPLFLAAHAGLVDNVRLLRQSGAHLHAEELTAAELNAQRDENRHIWALAGVGEDIPQQNGHHKNGSNGHERREANGEVNGLA
jgi:lysophospholipase